MRIPLRRLAIAVSLVVPVSAAAQAPVADGSPHREVRGQLGASINNMGVQNTLDLAWTLPLTETTNPLFRGAHISVGLRNALTPAQLALGGWVEIVPVSFLVMRGGVDPSVYFGTFNSLQSFDDYSEPFDTDSRKARGAGRAGTGGRRWMSSGFRVKAGPVVALTNAEFEWWHSSAPGRFYYEPTRDTLLRSSGDRLANTSAIVMYQQPLRSGTLSVGPIVQMTHVYNAPENEIRKLGLIAVREFAGTRFHLPNARLTAIVSKYLEDPSKQGQWTAAIGIGFTK